MKVKLSWQKLWKLHKRSKWDVYTSILAML